MKKIHFIIGFLALALFLTPRAHAQGIDFAFEEACLAGDTFHVNAYINSGLQESFKASAAEFSWGVFPASTELEDIDFLESIVVSKGIPTGKAILGWAEGYDGSKIGTADRTPFAVLEFTKKAELAGVLKVDEVRIFGFDDLEDKARLVDTKEFNFADLEACPVVAQDAQQQVADQAQVDANQQQQVEDQAQVDANQAQQDANQAQVDANQAQQDANIEPVEAPPVVTPVVTDDVTLHGAADPQPVQLAGTTQLQQTGPAENALLVLGLAFVWTLYRFRKLAYKFL